MRKPRAVSERRSPCCIHTPESVARPTRSAGTITDELHTRVRTDETVGASRSRAQSGEAASEADWPSCHAVQLGSAAAHAAQHAAAEADSGAVRAKVRSVLRVLARRQTPTCSEPQAKPPCAGAQSSAGSSTAAAGLRFKRLP